MEFCKFIHKTGVPKWRVPLNRARHAIYLIKNIPKERWTQSERQLVRKAKTTSLYWELLEEENQPDINISSVKTMEEPITPPDLIIGNGGFINDS